MNSCIILFLLLFCGQNNIFGSNGSGCGSEQQPPRPPRGPREQEPESCPCDDSRFEPRFESRPFGGSTCGCEES
jgi:hypothetical protein